MCLAIGTYAADTSSDVYVTASTGGETVKITPTKNIFYLPSSVDITKLELVSEGGDIAYENEDKSFCGTVSKGQTIDLSKASSTDERGAKCYKLKLTAGGKSVSYTFYADSSVASVFISTSQGISYIERNKENRDKESKILIISENGNIEYSDISANTESEIKGRGNATFSYYKKPYQIKLAQKTGILGMDKSKTWILLANYTDQSALHNALAFTLGDALGVPYNIEYRFTNLYIDGEYRGLYMICEKVQVDSSRVDIEDLEKATEKANPDVDLEKLISVSKNSGAVVNSTIVKSYKYVSGITDPEDITGGYLVELDNNYGTSEPCYFQTDNGNTYVIKSPEYASRAQVEYIATIFADMEEAIYSDTGYNSKGKHYTEYIDAESFAAVYTVQELMKNWDAYTSSMFFFKDADKDGVQSKIYMGPLWDLDNTLGNINFNKDFGTDTAYLWAQNGVFNNVVRTFAKNLMKHYDLQKVEEKVYAKAYDAVQQYLTPGDWFQTESELIYDSVIMERTRWEMYNSSRWLLNSYGNKSSVKFVQFADYGKYDDTTQTTALGFMRYYLSERAEALKDSIGKASEKPSGDNQTTTPGATTGTTSTTASTTGITSTTGATTGATDPAPAEPTSPNIAIVWGCIIGAAAIGICAVTFIKTKKKK